MVTVLLLVGLLSVPAPLANAAEGPVELGTAETYSVLGGQTVTNTGPSILNRDLGVSPGTAITGFPPGIAAGATHAADAEAAQAQSDLVIAYDDAAGRALTASVSGDLVGQTLVGGVYKSPGPLALSGTLTLDGQGDQNSVFIFQIASTLITASASDVNLINGAQARNVYWQVGSSATLGTGSSFVGTVMALTSISVTTGTVVEGRAGTQRPGVPGHQHLHHTELRHATHVHDADHADINDVHDVHDVHDTTHDVLNTDDVHDDFGQ